MPLFFFHLKTGDHLDEDTIGVDLPSLDHARFEAFRALADMLRDVRVTGGAMTGEAFEIVDETGQLALTARFDELLSTAHEPGKRGQGLGRLNEG